MHWRSSQNCRGTLDRLDTPENSGDTSQPTTSQTTNGKAVVEKYPDVSAIMCFETYKLCHSCQRV
eukprot:2134189-Amphidinium_carterae.2